MSMSSIIAASNVLEAAGHAVLELPQVDGHWQERGNGADVRRVDESTDDSWRKERAAQQSSGRTPKLVTGQLSCSFPIKESCGPHLHILAGERNTGEFRIGAQDDIGV